jgi:hypothetical protein
VLLLACPAVLPELTLLDKPAVAPANAPALSFENCHNKLPTPLIPANPHIHLLKTDSSKYP